MKIKLAYPNIRTLVPYCKLFLDSFLVMKFLIKVVTIIIPLYLVLNILLYSDYFAILNGNVLICLLVYMLKNYMYACVLYLKFKNKDIIINFDDNCMEFSQRKRKINRKKSILINENELLLVLDVKLSPIGVPIMSEFCHKDDFKKLVNYLSSDEQKEDRKNV